MKKNDKVKEKFDRIDRKINRQRFNDLKKQSYDEDSNIFSRGEKYRKRPEDYLSEAYSY